MNDIGAKIFALNVESSGEIIMLRTMKKPFVHVTPKHVNAHSVTSKSVDLSCNSGTLNKVLETIYVSVTPIRDAL